MAQLFAPCAGPRVFALPPGVNFGQALLDGLDARLEGHPRTAVAGVEIWVNTQRSRRTLITLLTQGPARLLPRIRVLGELGSGALAPDGLPAPGNPLRRRLELARLVASLVRAAPDFASDTAAFDLADSLAELLDEAEGAGLAPGAFAAIDPAEHAAHWQRSLQFLEILEAYAHRSAGGSGEGRLRLAARSLAQAWAAAPPQHPVLVAGSTGSRPATRAFMEAVAHLPQGAVILPGCDTELPADVWRRLSGDDAVAVDHPQYGMQNLADRLGFEPTALPLWHATAVPAPARNALVSLALRPAPVTDQWRRDGAALTGRLAEACAGITWLDAPDARSEARAIALALRKAAEDGRRAALVTPDRSLARRVTVELDRWGLIPDDSAGRPLALTPPGGLLRLVADRLGAAATPETLLALLKHPLVSSAPGARGPHLGLTARLERDVLRGGAPGIDWAVLSGWAAEQGAAAVAWIDWLSGVLDPIATIGAQTLEAMTARHRAAVEALAAGPRPAAAHALWDAEAGAAALALMEELAAEAAVFGPISQAEYRALLASVMAARDVPEAAAVTDERIAIWGTLEARIQTADLVVLGGLNEGVWPRQPRPDPWLSRGMRRTLGLASPERRIGLSAHDFQQAAGAPEVILSRAARDADAPTVASRWLLRLANLLNGLGPEGPVALELARERGAHWLAMAGQLDAVLAPVPGARRPAPRPPLAARPRALSVTQIETLVRDPYAIYARKVLRLKPLDRPGRAADALARGSALHAALEAFVAATADGLPANAEVVFADTTARILDEMAPWPAIRSIWAARLARAASWFLEGEAERRERGIPLAREVRGRRALGGTPVRFEVSARADRIDRTPGGYAIYDYKSGNVPSEREAAAFHLQLPLEAAIAAAGGFEGLAAAPATHLELIGVGARKSLSVSASPDDIALTWLRLEKLIGYYLDPASAFVARLRPQRITYASDYDQLSRMGEWADGDPPETGP